MIKRFDYRLIRQLLLFAVVVEEKSIRRAAARLSMSQPPLSQQLDELERRLKMPLLERSARGVRPTPEGEALLPEIQKLVVEAEMLNYSVQQVRRGHAGVINIGAVFGAMLSWVPGFRAALAKALPEAAVFTKEIDSADAADELLSKNIAFAVGHFETLRGPGIRTALLVRSRPVVLLPADDALASEKTLALADLSERDWVMPARDVSPFYVDSLIGACRAAGFDPHIIHEVSTTMREIAYVACGQGLGLVPEFFACMLPPGVVARPLSDAGPVIGLSIAWNEAAMTPMRSEALRIALGLNRPRSCN
ncbi:MAG: LysR substrate-binding domain-containing protein [Burkholderia sp.]|jgi:DNA-binding transcriptional LysR family regulator